MILDLMLLGLDAPVGGVGIAPLRGDGQVIDRHLARAQPVAKEGLAVTIGAGGVEIARSPARRARIEHREGAFAHRLDAAASAGILAMAEVDVTGTTQRGESKSERWLKAVVGKATQW
jgi:hypothetical protein